jgi:Kef-type K+ transport system membrane component KefB
MPPPTSAFDLSVLFFLQLTIILAACRVVGWIAKYLGQPQVVGEMIAGVLLGPSLFGLFFPDLQTQLFPASSKPILFSVCQIGLSLYMFLVGTEFRLEHFHERGKTAISVSLAGMLVPFALGALLALWLHGQGTFFPEKVRLHEAIMFMGASMCITAFPMLARIIVENKLAGTSLGTLALAAGAIDDVAAWCVLAIVLSSNTGDWSNSFMAIGGGAIYAAVVLMVLRPLLQRMTPVAAKAGGLTQGMLTFIILLIMLGSFCTDKIGVYAVFGAFLMGCAMPRGLISDELKKQIEPLTLCLLLPLFFTYSGLNTRLDLVNQPWLFFVAMVVLVAASVGKGVACWGAARLSGESQGTSMAIGALMNARGLMELILLNIGREKGIIGPEIFSILVLMAIVTTLAATPIFRWVRERYSVT